MNRSIAREQRSGRLLSSLIAVALCTAVVMAYQAMAASSASLAAARSDLQECQELASGIERMRQRPRIASLEIEAPGEVSARIVSAAGKAQLDEAAIIRVDPQAPKRIPKTQYQLRATSIQLGAVPLRTIVEFCHHLAESQQGSTIRDINLALPRQGASDREVWEAEITLTQMIFSPTST